MNTSSLFNPALNLKKAFLIPEECGGTACLWSCGDNVFKGKLNHLNLDICIFTQGLNVKQVFLLLYLYYFSFYRRFISSLVISSYFFTLECKCTWKKYLVLPYLTSVMCVNLSFAMGLDNRLLPTICCASKQCSKSAIKK